MSLSKKRILCLILACVTLLLCACGDNTEPVATETESDVESNTVETEDGDNKTPEDPDKDVAKNYIVFDSKEKTIRGGASF